MKSVELFLVLIGLVAVAQATLDFCDKALCGGVPHIGCNNTMLFASTCSADKKLAFMDSEHKKIILAAHNNNRNLIASGNNTKFQPASRMATMVWDEELATLATFLVRTCKYTNDCHNTDNFRNSGQNIAMSLSNMPHTWAAKNISEQMVNTWFAQSNDATMADLNSYNPSKNIGGFATIVIDNNYRVGCAGAFFQNPDYKDYPFAYFFACNYATTPVPNKPIYSSGPSGSKCTTGKNSAYSALCSTKEQY
ncbi:antigen 5 like allergen Cul n 1-like [Episyrphus balteatus]|uniref:antigen 5 like allergen Cul n 1-like n=1 Tax=Episyrphus balteatus TaxID=286459 RepID=UPI0024861303|nr:antigen 5 like allergen Cul n 1-like [Episyrphus balteatus]